ncbi:polysaccharide pyruvyl transferase family protein [Seonamhaeicola aphaedonensis]|uniref:Polysaccharide pyruvyl transferase n=1 Tax=Seonamhaeicola aphaedonensis TaxID=1461338 RepID=A0A3D9HHI6_9FLAO|nr:polysaccharide pyruvyl transferase family protein [Seonamhaeicola aphaedonensis]RED48940.1 polysaccharide pyruvyl transferase [Seonamhaeicola aphaedonensis]
MQKRKIGILTLPLHSNYGGLLQAYALQMFLKNNGYDAWLINYRDRSARWKKPFSIVKRMLLKYVLIKNITVFEEKEQRIIRVHTQAFINKHINPQTQAIYTSEELSRKIDNHSFYAVIVGSDQVWRPQYVSKIEDYFFDFIKSKNIIKLSYAASFGSSDWNFSPIQKMNCAKNIQSFKAVSVREDTGVELCKEHFEVEAKHVLDPTMLLEKEHYYKLVDEIDRDKKQPKGGLLVYILDDSEDITETITKISKHLAIESFRINNKKTYNKSVPLKERIAPPVENWLKGFYDAEFVIADSFHACVFSIIFNKPFIIYGNKRRGMTRFTSILSKLGLEDRLIYSSKDLVPEKLNYAFNWTQINERVECLKKDSVSFLQENLK